MKIPPFLNPGDKIAIVCPAGYMHKQKAEACIAVLKKWRYNVIKGKTLGGKSKNYFSGTPEERLNDLQAQLDDPQIKAVLCGRGGYGTTHLLDKIDWKKFKKNPKWIIGFSDITVLHNYVHEQLGIATIHGPMANAFNEGNGINRYTLSLKDTLEGKPTQYTCSANQLNRRGKTKAPVVGGNLSLLAHTIGTNTELNTDGKILFIEDIGEQLYNIERMLLQLKRSGKFKKLKGLIVGGFTQNKDTERPFGKDINQLIHDVIQEYKFPVCYGFPVSHEKENVALAVGTTYKLEVEEGLTTLSNC
jgi:muramoyltetrapeptide carboxypeptidase